MAKKIDLTGMRFGRLTVVEKMEGRSKAGSVLWRCQCSCGNEQVADRYRLNNGNVKSCGCLRHEPPTNKAHGHTWESGAGAVKSSTYKTWEAMRQRCQRETSSNYKYYGGKGISVCERWQDFSAFLDDMGEKPVNGWHLDRIDPSGNYEPSNCRWASPRDNISKMHKQRQRDYA